VACASPRPASTRRSARSATPTTALAETVIGLFKTELIKPCGPSRTVEQVEIATFEYVDWYNRRVGSPHGPGVCSRRLSGCLASSLVVQLSLPS